MIDIVTTTKEPPSEFNGACAVYQFLGVDGALLYVGISGNPQKRISAHSTTSKWFGMAAKVKIAWHKSKQDALNAEAKAIMMRKPMFNKGCAFTRVSDAFRPKVQVEVMRSASMASVKPEVELNALPQENAAASLIRQWCDDGGRKLSWLAATVPVNQSTFSRWMMGHAIPSAVYRNRLADVTGIEIAREEESWK